MTRKSRRELERAIDDLGGDHNTVQAWVNHYLESSTGFEFNVNYGEDRDHTGEVCVRDDPGSYSSVWIPEADVPEWIDPEVDLPI